MTRGLGAEESSGSVVITGALSQLHGQMHDAASARSRMQGPYSLLIERLYFCSVFFGKIRSAKLAPD
jgi:hypothetical protein